MKNNVWDELEKRIIKELLFSLPVKKVEKKSENMLIVYTSLFEENTDISIFRKELGEEFYMMTTCPIKILEIEEKIDLQKREKISKEIKKKENQIKKVLQEILKEHPKYRLGMQLGKEYVV